MVLGGGENAEMMNHIESAAVFSGRHGLTCLARWVRLFNR